MVVTFIPVFIPVSTAVAAHPHYILTRVQQPAAAFRNCKHSTGAFNP